jgi:hypothetical protein
VQVSCILRLGDGLSLQPMKAKSNSSLFLFSNISTAMPSSNNPMKGSVGFPLLRGSIVSLYGNNSLVQSKLEFFHSSIQQRHIKLCSSSVLVLHCCTFYPHGQGIRCIECGPTCPCMLVVGDLIIGKLVDLLASHSSTGWQ